MKPSGVSSEMKKPSVEWVDSLVAKRRERGGYSDEELAFYRAELIQSYGLKEKKS